MLPDTYLDLPSFSFGDTPEMADSGLADVIARRQTATCGAHVIMNQSGGFMPVAGVLEVVLDGRGNPGCVIRTDKVIIRRFAEVDESFAKMEACESLADWRRIHEAYFRRLHCFTPSMNVVCQYFSVVETFVSEPLDVN